jgi:hypothetical protein
MQGKAKRSILPDELKTKLISESIGITPDLTRDPFTLMETLSTQGVKTLTLLLGEDRMGANVFDLAAEKYGIKLKKVGIPRDGSGISGTKTRLAAGNNDWDGFFKMVAPSASQSTKQEVFKQLNSALGVKKYANGVFSVPGPKGAGDVVPALLSPGEAVIPAKQAAQHRPMIKQMIAGNLPGYAMGGIIPGYQYGIDSVPGGMPLKVIIVGDETKRIVSPENQEIKEITEGNTEEQKKATEETKKTRKSLGEYTKSLFTRTQATGQVQMGLYGVTSGLGIASTMGGGIGQAAQAAMVPLGAAATAMSLIPGKAGLIVAAFAAIGSTIFMVNEHLNKLRNEALDLGTAMGASAKSINKFAEFAKTVTGTQAMDKRREASAGQFFNVVQGKTTFGESYMKSEAGKELVKSVGTAIKGGGLDQAKSMITSQLTTAIASGAMSPAQARSIASNLAAQLGDMSMGIEIAGNITDLVGPKGEDLKKEPLQVRMRLVADAVDQFKKQAEISNQGVGQATASTAVASGGAALGGGVTGFIAGVAGKALATGMANAVAAGAAQSATGAMASTILGAQAFGPVVGAIAAIGILAKASIDAQGEIVKNAGYLQASLGSALSVQQQMVDSLAVDYEKRIASAQAAGDTAEATRLQNQYLTDQAELLQFNKEQTQEMYNILNNQSTGIGFAFNAQIANLDTAREGLKKAFEGTGQEVQAKLAQEQIDAMAGTNAQKTMLMSAVAQKQIGLNQIGVAQSAFGADQAGADSLQALMENSPTELNRTLGLAGSMGAVEQKKFLVEMSLADPIQAKQMNDAIELAQKTTGVFFGQKKTAEAIMKFAVENPEKMLEFQQNIADLKNVDKARFDITVAQKILGPDLAKALGEKSVGAYFKKYNKENKIVFLSEFQQVMTMLAEGDEDMLASWRLWQKETGKKGTMADYAAYQADRTVTSQGADNTLTPGEGGAGAGAAAGPQASFIDPYVQTIREASNLAQNITTGWFDSLKALNTYNKGTLNAFSGQAVLLKQAGASEGLIQAFLGGSEEDQNRMFAKAKGGISEVGRIIIAKAKQVEDAKIGLEYILSGPVGQMQKQNELYQSSLEVISIKEKKVNDKYDKRVKALDQIGKIQDKNNQKQQDTLTLADALSKGDIAAAARAAMTAKQNSQKQALEDAKEGIELARKNELEQISVKVLGQTVTRADLEAKIATNAEKIATSKQLELNRQVQIGIKAQETANAVSETLNTLKGYSKIKLPEIKVSTITATSLNATSINGALTNNPTVNSPTPDVDPAAVDTPVQSILGSAGTGGRKILNDIIASTDVGAASKQAKVVRSNYVAAKEALTDAGGEMSEAKAKQKFGGTNTAGYKKWAAANKKFASAQTSAESWNLFTGTGKLKTEDQLAAGAAESWLSDTEGYSSYVKSKTDKLPQAVLARLEAIKGGKDSFIADQNELKTLKTKIDDIKKNFSGASASFKNKTVFQMLQNYNATSDALKPKTAYGQLLAGGADPAGYMDKGVEMANKFIQIDGYRKDLVTAGYSFDKLLETGLLNGSNGQTVETISDFKTNQMFIDRKRHNPAKRIHVDTDNLTNFANRYYAMGGMVYANRGLEVESSKYALGTDTIPAMLTAGEFVMKKAAVDRIGAEKLTRMNEGTSSSESVYNYSITVNANSSDASGIADAVLREVQRIDSRRIRSSTI